MLPVFSFAFPAILVFIFFCTLQTSAFCPARRGVCQHKDFFLLTKRTKSNYAENKSIYILYDVNSVEGFNLRRDVYIRLAVFLKALRKKPGFEQVQLVLPPFPRLYHWKSDHVEQDGVLWKKFFDVPSMRRFAAVLDFDEFLDEIQKTSSHEVVLDEVYQLRNFEDMFENGVFIDKFEEQPCRKESYYRKHFFNNPSITHEKFACLQFQGSASLLGKFLRKKVKRNKEWPFKILFLNAEIVLHDFWGNKEFWRARRSMRFSQALKNIAAEYRFVNFNTNYEADKVQAVADWREEKPYRDAIGGEYLCAHVRRGDFVHGREKSTPSLKSVANQITAKLKHFNLSKVFVASDCSAFEYQNLKAYLGRMKVFRFRPASLEEKVKIMDGGIAIVDQIICSHARFFIGTYESTFTYRIYEEREILGFPKEMTFNTFCKNDDLSECEKNSIWPIVF